MSKLLTNPIDSKQAANNGRMLTKKKIANYSYILNDSLGEGYSSKVYRGINELTNAYVAIKCIDMSRINNEIHHILLQSEIECLKRMTRCQHVIQFFDVHATKNNTYIVTEFCQEGDLSKLVKKGMSEQQAIVYMKQIIAGYLQIHKKGIIHRDLKPANIFLKDKLLKIADFGFAVKVEDARKSNKYNIGSPLYMPPESLLYNQYSFKSDIWALGIIFYEMLTGSAPWSAKTEKELANKIMSDSIIKLLPDSLSPESIDFLTRTLECSVNDRMSPEQLKGFSFMKEEKQSQPMHSLSVMSNFSKSGNRNYATNRNTTQQVECGSSHKTHSTSEFPPLTTANTLPDDFEPLTESVRKDISRQLLAQIHLCRFLYKLIKRMEVLDIDTSKLRQQFAGLIFHKLKTLCSCENSNPFNIERMHDYRSTSDFSKFLTVAKQYDSKYRDDIGRLSRGQWREKYNDLLQQMRVIIETVYTMLKDMCPDDAPIQKDYIILVDYLITTYQLVQLTSRNDLKEFSKKSKIETIVEGQPASINYSHFKAVQEKLALMSFI